MPRRRASRLSLLLLLAAGGPLAEPVAAQAPSTMIVVGVENRLPKKAQRDELNDLRLGMGIRGRLVALASASGAYFLLEDRALASSVRAAIDGYWVSERAAGELRDPESLRRAAAVDWVLFGSLEDFGVRRSGSSFGVKWRYRAEVRLCLGGGGGAARCASGEGTSVDKKRLVGVSYRGDDVVWDQAGPAEAIDAAVTAAAAELLPRASGGPLGVRDLVTPGQRLQAYVASFGLSTTVARAYPELAASQTGLGICSRIVDALWDSERFTFLEEKAEVLEQMVALMRDEAAAARTLAAPEAPWLLYGEVVDLQVVRDEKLLKARAELETRLTLQVRLVDRASRRFVPATGTGVHRAKLIDWQGGGEIEDLDARSVALATDAAVREAVARLVALLFD